MENKKIILIPGWMNAKGMYEGDYDILEVWKNRLLPEEKIEADCLVAHSLGCSWALFNWGKNKNTRLILINPLLPKRNLSVWFWKWLWFQWKEKKPVKKEIVSGIKNKWFGIKTCRRLLKESFDKVLENISKENIIIICGEKDFFYCDKTFKEYVKSKNIRTVEVRDAGHDWRPEIDLALKNILADF